MSSIIQRRSRLKVFLLLGLLLPSSALAASPEKGTRVRLAEDGKALFPVVVAKDASERVRGAARTLAAYLERITGARFETITGDGKTGIALGLPAHFPELAAKDLGDARQAINQEDYLLRAHERGLHLLGNSDQAVEHAVWDLLYRLGHRQFFPGETWEIVPHERNLSIAVATVEHPAYYSRRIWYGYGPWDYAAGPYADWCARNRATAGLALNTGHAYEGILHAHQAEFKQHPEYLGLVNGERKSSKFCISNPGLRKLVVDDALARLARDPAALSISMEPSDGPGWCECEQCRALGSPSDRALLLANEVAAAARAKYGEKYVGMYAYSQHAPPPHLKVDDHVIISVATAFIHGGYTVDQLLDGWHAQGATLGIREYYSVNTWDRDLPGAARGAQLDYLTRTIPHFHDKGARFFSAESSDNWGPNGLGYYLAARMLWDVREAQHVDELVADFLEKAFGSAREPMTGYYQLIAGLRRPLLSDDLLGRMYRFLAEAQKRTDDPAVRKRLDDLVLYTHYVELYFAYSTAEGRARQQAFEALIRHTYRMRKTMMVHSKALYRDLAARDKKVTLPKEAAWDVAEKVNPWKSSEPFTRADLDSLVTTGIAAHPLIDFQPLTFSTRLMPADKLALPEVPAGNFGLYSRGQRSYYTWVENPPATLTLGVKAGIIYTTSGDAKLALVPVGGKEEKAVAHATVQPDKEQHRIELTTTVKGLHRVEVEDNSAGTNVVWPEKTPVTVASSLEAPATFHGRWSLYFYVPKGTKVVGGFASGAGELRDGSGKLIHTFEARPGYFRVEVPAGEDGKLWQFHNSNGQRLLMTVPPYLARSGKDLLLPAEVVEKDGGK